MMKRVKALNVFLKVKKSDLLLLTIHVSRKPLMLWKKNYNSVAKLCNSRLTSPDSSLCAVTIVENAVVTDFTRTP